MILKEWSEAQDIYKATFVRWGRSVRTLWAPSKVKSYWYIWVSGFSFLLSAAFFVRSIISGNPSGTTWLAFPSLWCTILTLIPMWYGREKALSKEFATDYTTHAISHYPFWSRPTYFTYALFLHELEDRKYSRKKAADLSSFAQIATPPKVSQLRPFQNPIVIYLMGLMTGLSLDYIKQSEFWRAGRVLEVFGSVIIVLFLILIALLLYSIPRIASQERHQTIQRYLQWAEKDLKEEQPF